MDLRPLGRTGLLVSPIALGTVKLGRNTGLKYPGQSDDAPKPLPSDEQVETLLRTAADRGVNLIDTAPAYGSSEQRVGEAMRRLQWLGSRQRWVLCTKVGEEFDGHTAQSTHLFTPEHTRVSVERSLRRLGVDTLDVVLAHSDGRDEWILEHSGVMDMLRELRSRGIVRAIGISSKTVDGGLLAVRTDAGGMPRCDVVMITYNPAERREGLVIDAAAHRGVGVLIKKALASGHVSKLAAAGARSGGSTADEGASSVDPIAAAVRFAVHRAGVSSVIIGTSNPAHLGACIDAANSNA